MDAAITAVVLAGGRGSRMGGLDKGLQPYHGTPLAQHALQRLRQQQGVSIAAFAINANRHLEAYAAFGAPVWPDTHANYPGPLAGFLAALRQAGTPLVLTVPCDTPRFPPDLALRLFEALQRDGARLALAHGPDGEGPSRPHPVCCLMHTDLADDLAAYLDADGRKVGAWMARHACSAVPFERPGDDPLAFANANTLDELRALEHR